MGWAAFTRPAGGRRPARCLGRPSRLVSVGARRRHRGGRGDRVRHRSLGGLFGRLAAAAWPLLVLHRPEPDSGLLGRLPVTRRPAVPETGDQACRKVVLAIAVAA